jgi:hypothetical protein
MKKIEKIGMKRNSNGIRPVMPESEPHLVNEDGVFMEDMIMCAVLGTKEIPKGHHVKHRDGNTLNNCRSNLELVSDSE